MDHSGEQMTDRNMDYITVDMNPTVVQWVKLHESGELTKNHLTDFWRDWVPKIYQPTVFNQELTWTVNEDMVTDILIGTLERFICNGKNPDEVMAELHSKERASSVCGRVFKMGEPTYLCRECGVDKTCVLCVDCFKNSVHRFHKYRMGSSGGGGCCDCGDPEAWKLDPYCSNHPEPAEGQSQLDVSPDMIERSRFVFEVVAWHVYNLLTTEHISDVRLGDDTESFFDVDNYCTILYNDEVHTFEQVITTLTRVMQCTQRVAIDYVTNIDREGRSIVKCSNFQECSNLKDEIEKYTSRHGNRPLKVLINHAYIIGHQMFSLRLLTWLRTFLGHGKEFRAVFAEIATKQTGTNPCLIKAILLRDCSLWKNARTHWHKLLIVGMLMEYENKKALAKIFTRNYGQVLKDFIKDDHDHSYSIASLSVQLFTVPTLAHHLIEHEDVLYILMNTLMSECCRKCNKFGKLEFERTAASSPFKRSLYTLYDLRYLLGTIPPKWTDELKKRFLHGLTLILNLLGMMQGMDAATRQVGQHMEYEPDWESGFNLHIKLAFCISLLIQWCATDEVVLTKAYRLTLKKLEETPCYEPGEGGVVREIADHTTSCVHYDVASKPVSIHLPLSRFWAGLYAHIEQFNLHTKNEFLVPKPTPVQLIEPVLRAQVMVAQVHAGMWRRNGYALLNTLFFYHNVKCRTEMLDRDISMLQIGATLIESNEFLIHVINKCNLTYWASPEFEENTIKANEEDSMRQVISLVEEMFHILIVIIGERYMPGISDASNEDRIKKELIQHLCIKPLPHSELVKVIPEELTGDNSHDDIILNVATFKKPSGRSGHGVYELKPECYDEYNCFYYHYTREEQSKSEEAQRLRRKNAGELDCCPPPKLRKLRPPFIMLANLLQCDVMLHLMQCVLKRCQNLRARSFSELQLHKVLHLIGYALHEEESRYYEYFRFIENSQKFQILELLEELLTCRRVDAHKDLLKWTIMKFKQVQKLNSGETPSPEVPSTSTDTPKSTEESDKIRRAKLAAERRAKLMNQMKAAQNTFMKENAKMFEDAEVNPTRSSLSMSESQMELADLNTQKPVALGPYQSPKAPGDPCYTCILCQEEDKLRPEGPTLVLAAFVQQATVLCQHKNSEELMDVSKHDHLFLHANLGPAPHVSTCGHVMHSDCWRKYFDNIMLRENRRPYRLRHPASFDVEKQEFLCPLCECLSNTVLPLTPPLSSIQTNINKSRIPFDVWLNSLKSVVTRKNKVCHGLFNCNITEPCENQHCSACLNSTNGQSASSPTDCEANCMFQRHQVFYTCPIETFQLRTDTLPKEFIRLFPVSTTELDKDLQEMIRIFTQVTFTRGLGVHPHPADTRVAPIAWKSLAYTIHSVEVLLRDSGKPLLGHLSSRQRDCLENLVRLVGVLGTTMNRSVWICSDALNLLSKLMEHPHEGPSVLQWDSFGFLVSLTYSLPSLSCKDLPTPAPTGGTLEMHTLRLMFVAHITKILIMMNVDSLMTEDVDESEEFGECEELREILVLLGKSRDNVTTKVVWNYIQYCSYPFLRCCILFYHYLTDVPAPVELTEDNGDTFENMCDYLSLPTHPSDLLNSPEVLSLVQKWINHEEVQIYLNGAPLQIIQEPLPINRLVELPTDYSELLNMVSSFSCPNSDEDSRNPTMCLVCGELLCSQSYCCQTELEKTHVGACNYHAHKCGAGVGIFLRVRECEVLYLATPFRGAFVSPPYLDDYGETDQGLRRGNPLKLCTERYHKLQTLWLKHGIHEEIARSIETNHSAHAMQWNQL